MIRRFLLCLVLPTFLIAVAGTLLVPIFFRLIQGVREIIHRGPTKFPE